eukprot:TRINITY_DN1986_c0_g1_i9.p1 TRINITY_DN1986_c0_g1~~TRINITY_DN1986_c0_g1_i9.p1  ORF type:complete len:262 (-),score=77.33 TRINITY_DN1986_c0_g1_i9:159-923(-)
MIRRPPRSTHCISSAASDVYKRQPFSDGKNFECTPGEKKLRSDSAVACSPFEQVIERKSNELRQMQCFKLDMPATELYKDQIISLDVDIRQIHESDIEYLKTMITANPPKKPPPKKSHKAKPKPLTENAGAKRRAKPFKCKYCTMSYSKAQALGGHMSRTHPGESCEYKLKKNIRKNRKMERIKLLLAKRKFFKSLNYDYDDLLKTPEGKIRVRMLINRTRIKKLKKMLTKEELESFAEAEYIDNISACSNFSA